MDTPQQRCRPSMSGRRSTPLLAPPLALLLLLLLFLPPWMKVSFCIPQCSLEREGGSIRWASTSSLPLIASSAALGIASAADAKEEEEEEVVPFSSTSVKPKHRYLRDNIRVVLLNEEEMEKKKAGRSMPSDGRIIEETTKFSFIFPHLSTSTTTTTTRKPDKFHSFQPTTQLRIPEGSLYPSDFHLIYPDVDEVRPDDPQDPVEYLYSPEFRREDLLHTPFAYSLGYQSFAGIQLSNFATSGFLIGESERAALLEDTAQRASREGQADASPVPTEAQLQRPERSFSPAKEDAAAAEEEKSMRNTTTAPAPVEVPLLPTAERVRSPKELLRRLIRGDGSYSPLGLRPFTDRYVVQQMDPGVFRRSFCDILVQLMHLPDRPPLVISLFNLSPGKMALRCLFYRTHQFLTAKRKFVIVAAEGDYPAAVSFFVDPDLWDFPILNLSFLLHHPLLAHWYGVNGNINHPKFTPLPIGYRFFHRAGETLLPYDRTRRLNEEKQHVRFTQFILKGLNLTLMFPHIKHPLKLGRQGITWLEDALDTFADNTVDPAADWIALDQLPQRITTIYIVAMPLQKEKRPDRPSLTDQVLIFRRIKGGIALENAQHIALLPFTAAVYHKLLQHPYGSPQRERKVVVAFSVWEWRKDLMAYFRENSEISIFPGKSQIDFFDAASNYTFVMSPMGYGYDCYRTWETLVLGAIPIIQRPEPYHWKNNAVGTFGELHYQINGNPEVNSTLLTRIFEDLPVVVVQNATDITEENMKVWQQEIFEKAKRGEYNLEKLFMQTWIDRIYGHTNDS